MSSARSLHIVCATWDQVEAFYARKLRRGNLIAIKVAFPAEPGEALTLSLELPSQLVVAIDGVVRKQAPIDGSDRAWLELELVGLTSEIVTRLRDLVAQARHAHGTRAEAPGAFDDAPAELPADERRLFAHLSAELRRLRALPALAVLGVRGEPTEAALRRGYVQLLRRYHPDQIAARRSPAISHLAEELAIVAARALRRCEGPAARPARGWLLGGVAPEAAPPTLLSPVAERRRRASSLNLAPQDSAPLDPPEVTVAAPEAAPSAGGEAFERRARTLLAEDRALEARELVATALSVYPRSRPLRVMHHVAAAVVALAEAQTLRAEAELGLALAVDPQRAEALTLLEWIRVGEVPASRLREVFR